MKDEIKRWLKENSLSREWLAERIGVSKRTVDNWLSSSIEIPARSESQIKILMEDAAKIADGLASQIFSVECSLDQFRQFSRAALEAGMTLEEWTLSVMDSEARDFFRKKTPRTKPEALTVLPQPPHLTAAAGPAIEAEVMETSDALIRVRLFGDSMEPLFQDGQIIEMNSRVASRSPYMRKGLIYLVRIDGGFAVKRYSTRKPTPEEVGQEWASKGRVGILESINPAYPPITIRGDIEWLAWLDPKEKGPVLL